nr:hypothetical protein OG409_23615 [Streptomyces sp. NBC_00974]
MTDDRTASGAAPRKRRLLIGAAWGIAVGVGLSGCTGDSGDAGPATLSSPPCWGLLTADDVAPVLERGKSARAEADDLGLTVTKHRLSTCHVSQDGSAGEVRGSVEWRPNNPHRNSDPKAAWHTGVLVDKQVIDETWGAGGGSWPTGARVAVQCDVELPAGSPDEYRSDKFLEVHVEGAVAKGADEAKARRAFADMTLKLAKGVAQKVGCTNDLALP